MKIGVQELMIVLFIVLILFGPRQIPRLSKIFGRSIKSFKDGINSDDEELGDDVKEVKAEKAEKAEAGTAVEE